ncbi:MAG: CBS domain-containing protein [Desulfatiglans sp.]|jgi:CBS domain-containing protein|nr:CBS domain-containing protein [Thermodesulfobacteriota bacterium]MEE4352438.1 CBS domain-containing protein [Desulfatiglans sp.]
MKTTTVKDLMVPLEEYPTVSQDATLYDAVLALEKAQEEFDKTRYRHRAILVFDETKHIIGKISQMDVIIGLEPKYQEIGEKKMITRSGFSPQFLKSILEQYSLWDAPLDQICRKASKLKVKDFMYTPSEREYVKESATLGEAIHQLVMGHHHSLLVTRGDDIVGILRLTDVFKEVFDAIKSCKV